MKRKPTSAKVPPITEAQFQKQIIQYAKLRGWMVCHFRPARTAKGWRTAIEGDKGFPDLVLARRGVLLLMEVKSTTGKQSDEQVSWMIAASNNYFLVRPADWHFIERRLLK